MVLKSVLIACIFVAVLILIFIVYRGMNASSKGETKSSQQVAEGQHSQKESETKGKSSEGEKSIAEPPKEIVNPEKSKEGENPEANK